MPGMDTGIKVNDPTVVAAFKSALIHQGTIALLALAVIGLAWMTLRTLLPAETSARSSSSGAAAAGAAAGPGAAGVEPAWRRLLRIGFGLLWLFDGILQAQPKMAIGLPSRVIAPAAASSPSWVQHVVNWAGTTWSYHPLQAGAAAVWIQVGIGGWLLVSARGPLSRLAGVASVVWGLIVWVFGEAFGGIFAPGLTWLFGAPGAVALYVVGGALIALPTRVWRGAWLGRLMLGGTGAFLVGMAILQAWPGRGFWQGTSGGGPGTLAGMTSSMTALAQPHFLAAIADAFVSSDEAHGFAVNLVVVAALAGTGLAFASGRRALIRPALVVLVVLCAADWVLVEDVGFFGGLGTDPNSMIPFALLAVAGYLAAAPTTGAVRATKTVLATTVAPGPAVSAATVAPGPAVSAATVAPGPAVSAAGPPVLSSARDWWQRARARVTPRALASASLSSVAAVGAIGVIALGAVPMAVAQASPVADPILAQAIAGQGAYVNSRAPDFSLTDQHGREVSLASLRGKVVLLTLLDDTCTLDCPLIAQEFRLAGQLLGSQSGRVELVAINYNPIYTGVSYIRAFDHQEGLAGVPNWLFLTGSRSQLQHIWARYSAAPVEILPAGSMIGHGDYAYVIDQGGQLRQELDFDVGPGTQASKSSFAAELAAAARQLLRRQP